MDFGLAKIQGVTTLTAPSSRLGTPQYMSPEQVLGQEADARADLYAFGVVPYELATGIRPFDSDEVQAILFQHINLPPVPPSAFNPDLPQALEVLILRLLEKDPSRRPASARDVLRALEGLDLSPPAPLPSQGRGENRLPLPCEGRGAGGLGPASHFPLGRLTARTALLGHSDELDFLKSQYETVAAGARGRLIFVNGEPAVGKAMEMWDAMGAGPYAERCRAKLAELG